MTISMNEKRDPKDRSRTNGADDLTPAGIGGAFADGLTLVRLAVTPLIMGLILWQWPDPQIAILASALFIIAALTDIFDDWFGGSSRSVHRRYGFLDDAADTVLVSGALLALLGVMVRDGLAHWMFAVPVILLVMREICVGVIKGRSLARYGFPDSRVSNAKAGFAMLGTALLVGAPWLSLWVGSVLRSNEDGVADIYTTGSPIVWMAGLACLWIAAVFSLISAYRILTHTGAESETL